MAREELGFYLGILVAAVLAYILSNFVLGG